MVTIVYAIIGLPLFLLYLSNIGDILAKSFKWTYARCCLCKCRRKPLEMASRGYTHNGADIRRNHWQMVDLNERKIDTFSVDRSTSLEDDEARERDEDDSSSYDPQRVTVPLTLCVAIMVGYIWGGAILFSEWEDWNMLDGSYFCFVSLSTIGFGDIVPGDKIYSAQGLDLSFIFCSMYLMLGECPVDLASFIHLNPHRLETTDATVESNTETNTEVRAVVSLAKATIGSPRAASRHGFPMLKTRWPRSRGKA
ncbi:hypothetical protein K0M31_017244 [Melipona bicolor]|uniref:Potassium channel domain-containing protein n=1 Tax=Melipona bicolor TaxID=60889 RepID=A0AA40G5N8_9HYME|nr:hypothetical protein K0M31_017244 [Melipona bicolor]